uniref:LRAT domain-containing protein n=1 Tax=Bos taurus TaxID=9913 RepID=A0A3Q1MK26_BOVIN
MKRRSTSLAAREIQIKATSYLYTSRMGSVPQIHPPFLQQSALCVSGKWSLGKISGTGWSSIMSSLADRARVKKERLCDVVGKDPYRVNNKHDDKYNPFPPSKIVQLVEKLVGREFCYHLLHTNCEHFVNELRYGVSRSDQVRDAVTAATISGVGLIALSQSQ